MGKVFQKVGKLTGPKPPKALRGAYLSRQYASQELGKQFPPKCNLVKVKKLKGPAGWMYWGGSGDVHYHSFAHCYYDDQSIGEWTALRVLPKYWKMYPIMVQFRTSPQRQRCSWCQNGAGAYIDGCAVMYKGEKASCGFGGFVFPNSAYPPYCGFNGKQLPNNRWMRGKYMRVKGYTTGYKRYGSGYGNFYAYLTDGTQVYCGKGSIRIRASRKLIGKISGIAGNGLRAREWIVGPNRKASGGLKPGTQAPGLARICKHRYQYPYPRSPFQWQLAEQACGEMVQIMASGWEYDPISLQLQERTRCGLLQSRGGPETEANQGSVQESTQRREGFGQQSLSPPA